MILKNLYRQYFKRFLSFDVWHLCCKRDKLLSIVRSVNHAGGESQDYSLLPAILQSCKIMGRGWVRGTHNYLSTSKFTSFDRKFLGRFTKLFPILLGFILSSCSPTYVSQTQQAAFEPDGIDKEWPEKMLYNAKSDWIYGVTHDKENLYIFLEVENPRIQSKILVNGLTVWINGDGGRKREKGIHFPIGAPKAPPADLKYTNPSKVDLMTMQRNYLGELTHLELIGLNGRTVWTELRRQEDIIPRIGFDREGRLLYEAKIPFNSYFLLDPTESISIGFETGSFDRPNQLEGLNSGLGESESLRAQSRIMALSELTVPTEMWIKKLRVGSP